MPLDKPGAWMDTVGVFNPLIEYERLRARLGPRLQGFGNVLPFELWAQRRDDGLNLELADMQAVVDRAISALQHLYVHMDLKRARRAVDPVGQSRVLAEWLESSARPGSKADQRTFHKKMLEIFKSLGDVHTAYRLPPPYADAVAFLPFLVKAYYAGDERRYTITHTLWEQDQMPYAGFAPGVEVTTWNGMPMEKAVEQSAQFEEGSNTPNDLALGLQYMTVRWLGASFEPDSPWVLVGFKAGENEPERDFKFFWSVMLLGDEQKLLVSAQAAAAVFRPRVDRERAVHTGRNMVHRCRLELFAPHKKTPPEDVDVRAVGAALPGLFFGYCGRDELVKFTRDNRLQPRGDDLPTLLPVYLEARSLDGNEVADRAPLVATGEEEQRAEKKQRGVLRNKRFGYMRIRAFPLDEPARSLFNYEVRRLLSLMPRDGLILDVRDNPGGSANNAESLLQCFTPNEITPLPFRFVASHMTKELAMKGRVRGYQDYEPSITAALRTGAAFSAGLPITPVEDCNRLGQTYFGPVVLVTNATTYSAADIFAAGFEDNRVGAILGVDETTGGGGANCWFYNEEIADESSRLDGDVNFQMAVRQCTRVGREVGMPIEEIGIPTKPALRYRLTKADVTEEPPWGLFMRAATEVSKLPSYDLVTTTALVDGRRSVTVLTEGIDRLDVYVNGRPSAHDVKPRENGSQTHGDVHRGKLGETRISFTVGTKVELEIRGFAGADTAARRVARYVQFFHG